MELKEKPTRPSIEYICYLIKLFPLGYFHLTHISKNKLYVKVNKYKCKWTNLTERDKTQSKDRTRCFCYIYLKKNGMLHCIIFLEMSLQLWFYSYPWSHLTFPLTLPTGFSPKCNRADQSNASIHKNKRKKIKWSTSDIKS